jgi:RNA polymerase sigma-70 factor (ECF subfamily)
VAGAESAPSQGPANLAGLVQAARTGDEQAWCDLVAEYGPRVFALARSRLRDPDAAEEVTQSVFATIAIKLRDGRYDEHGKFEPWLFRIAMNRVRDTVRRAKRERLQNARPVGNQEPRAGAPEGAEPPPHALRDALERLSHADRDIIELRYHADLSFRQIADLLGEPLGTLLARHHRALRKIQRILAADTDHPAVPGEPSHATGEMSP